MDTGAHAQGWPRSCPICRMTARGVLGIWRGTCPGPSAQVPMDVPRFQLPASPGTLPLSLPWTRSHSKWPPSVALAGLGLSVLPPAGGEGQSLQQQQQLGLWVIAGFLTFLALEKMFLDGKEKEATSQVSPRPQRLHRSACSMAVPRPGGPGSESSPEKRVSWPFLGALASPFGRTGG